MREGGSKKASRVKWANVRYHDRVRVHVNEWLGVSRTASPFREAHFHGFVDCHVVGEMMKAGEGSFGVNARVAEVVALLPQRDTESERHSSGRGAGATCWVRYAPVEKAKCVLASGRVWSEPLTHVGHSVVATQTSVSEAAGMRQA